MPNPTQTQTDSTDGIWLLPYESGEVVTSAQCWIRGNHPDEGRSRALGEMETPFREETFTQAGVLHLRRGTIEGTLMDGHGKTAAQWKNRLERLVRDQKKYARVMLATTRDFIEVELTEGLVAEPHDEIAYAWTVSVPYKERA